MTGLQYQFNEQLNWFIDKTLIFNVKYFMLIISLQIMDTSFTAKVIKLDLQSTNFW